MSIEKQFNAPFRLKSLRTLTLVVFLISCASLSYSKEKICVGVEKEYFYTYSELLKYEMIAPDGGKYDFAFSSWEDMGTRINKFTFTPWQEGEYKLYSYKLFFGLKVNYSSVEVFDTNINFTVSGTNSIYCGGSTTLTATPAYGALSFSWTGVGSGSSVTVSPKQTTTYTVTASDGCGKTKSQTYTVIVNPFPLTITQNPYQCPGGSFSLTATGAQTYSWTGPGLFTNTGPSVTGFVANNSSGATLHTVSVTGYIPGCPSQTQVTMLTVYSPTIATPVITGPSDVCITNGSNIFSFNGSDAYISPCNWTLNANINGVAAATFVDGNTSPAVRVAYNQNIYTNVAFGLEVTVTSRCNVKSAPGKFWVNMARTVAAAPSSISGPTSVCNSGSLSYYALGGMTPGVEYEVLPLNAVASSSTSQYGQINIDWSNSFVGSVTIRARIKNGCGYSAWSPYKSVYVSAGACRMANVDDQDNTMSPDALTVSVYPNPFNETANLKIDNIFGEECTVEIFDDKGRSLYKTENVSSGTELNVGEELKAGAYVVKVSGSGNVKMLKFIKQD